jgi:hypothetical protein
MSALRDGKLRASLFTIIAKRANLGSHSLDLVPRAVFLDEDEFDERLRELAAGVAQAFFFVPPH